MFEMGEKSNNDYLTTYRKFFEDFESSVNPKDQLPVKVAGYHVAEFEISGEVADWALQYLNERRCPPSLVAPIIRTLLDEIHLKCKAQPGDCGYRPQMADFQSFKLMQAATNQLIDVCKRYLNNAQLSTLPSPPSAILQAPPVSSCGIKNTRRTMEDRHIALQDLHTLFNIKGYGTASYFAVFDGHNGTEAAVYSVSHLHQFLMESPHYPEDPITALQDAFIKTDDYFKEKCAKDDLKSGTTVVCCLLRPQERMLYVAWAGDSQAVLVKNGFPYQIVKPHKPNRPDERTRIEDLGGSVLHWGVWRVNGQIAVSRAIGDQMCKPFVIADPEIKAIPLDGTEDFIILACDGLWDVVQEEQAMYAVYNYLQEAPGDLEGVSQRLVQLAKNEGSTDNISVVVVFLSEPCEVVKRRPMETASPSNPFHKQNGSELYCGGPPNGSLRCFQEDEEEDFGPETDVDAVDDVLMSPSSIAAAKALVSSQNKDLEDDLERQRQQLSEFDDPADADRSTNTPTPPARDVVGLSESENVTESGGEGDDSDEEEWNYFKGEEKTNSELTKEEIEQMESQLNPDAPVFVPESVPLPIQLNDEVISSSPLKSTGKSLNDIALPTQNAFHKGIIECAGEFNRLNGVETEKLNDEQLDDKSKSNFHPDESEILSTKAECGDDSVFSFSASMNTSTAFSSGFPHDDEDKASSEALFSNDNDFDPAMDAPKELQDLVSPELDDNLVPGTPRSTIAEASVSPTNIDTSPFMDLEKDCDLGKESYLHEINNITQELQDVKTDSVNAENNIDTQEQQDLIPETQKALTFAEVLKRPSPRTSPEPPVEIALVEGDKPLSDTNPFAQEIKDSISVNDAENIDHNPLYEETVTDEQNNAEDTSFEQNYLEASLKQKIDAVQETESNVISDNGDNFTSSGFVFNNDAKQDVMDEIKEATHIEDEKLSPFVTFRKSSVDDAPVEFCQLKSPDDEKPPQFFQVDDSTQLPENLVHPLAAEFSQPQLLVCVMPEKSSDDLQFMSTNSEVSVTEFGSDLEAVSHDIAVRTEQVDVAPEDLQFGTVNSKFEFETVGDYNHSAGPIETKIESKGSNLVAALEEFLEKEDCYEIKSSPLEFNDPALDFKVNDSHFEEDLSNIIKQESPSETFENNFESKFDAHEVTLEQTQSEISDKGEFAPPVSSPVRESNLLFGTADVFGKPFSDQIPELNEKENEVSSVKVNDVFEEIVVSQVSNNEVSDGVSDAKDNEVLKEDMFSQDSEASKENMFSQVSEASKEDMFSQVSEASKEDIFSQDSEASKENMFSQVSEASKEDMFSQVSEASKEDIFSQVSEASKEDMFSQISKAPKENIFEVINDKTSKEDKFPDNITENEVTKEIIFSHIQDNEASKQKPHTDISVSEISHDILQPDVVPQEIVEETKSVNTADLTSNESTLFKENSALLEVIGNLTTLPPLDLLPNVASEKVCEAEFKESVLNEPVIEQKQVDSVLSTPVKQQEETLEQTINVDFIPAEPLATPEVPKEELVKNEAIPEVVAPTDISESVEESSKDTQSATGTPPPTPAPGIAEQKPEEKEGLLAAAAAAAAAGAAVTAGVIAAKTAVKKQSTTSATAAKKTAVSGPKKPTDLGTKAGTKMTSSPSSGKPAVAARTMASTAKPTAPARKSVSSTVPVSKTATKPVSGVKSSPLTVGSVRTVSKPSTPTSKPSTPPSKPTTPTSSSRPSSATKTSPTKPSITARSTLSAAAKPRSSLTDKKPLTNGDVSKPSTKKPEMVPAKKASPAMTTKPAPGSPKPLASKVTNLLTSRVGSVNKTASSTTMTTSMTSKPKPPATRPATTSLTTSKPKFPAKPSDKTVKETVNKQISSSRPGVPKTSSKPTTTALKKTDTKTANEKVLPGKTALNKSASTAIKKPSTITDSKKDIKTDGLTQEHIITTTNGYTEELIENEVKIEKDSSPLNDVCDGTVATN
ncbi:uncharacterized protein LOC142324071 [Lycorma delicatula]|uniref:uncharacterized protein LOC142324071 n=1 Tax=Lycorma delicatula TaxID=130591 RepID=UPI003F514126